MSIMEKNNFEFSQKKNLHFKVIYYTSIIIINGIYNYVSI